MKACPRCATGLLPGATVCSGCGLSLTANATATPTQELPPGWSHEPTRPKDGWWHPFPSQSSAVLALVVVVLAGAVAVYFAFVKHAKNNNAAQPPVPISTPVATATQPTTQQTTSAQLTQLDLGGDVNSLSHAESAYKAANQQYTTESQALHDEGFQQVGATAAQMLVGVSSDEQTFCIVAASGGNPPWTTYGITPSGQLVSSFSSVNATSAEVGCENPSITTFVPVS